MRFFLGVGLHQCRVVANLGLGGLLLLGSVAVLVELAAGVSPRVVLSGANLALVLATIAPEFLQVLVPLAAACGLLSLHEGGELAASRASGVHPVWIGGGVLLPLLPLVLLLHPAVHATRPAALLAARQQVVESPAGLLTGLEARGVGMIREADRFRALLPIGDKGMAVVARRADWSAPTNPGDPVRPALTLGRGQLHVAAAQEITTFGFEAMRLELAAASLGLSIVDETALSTRFLETQAIRWQRARLRWTGGGSRKRIRTELTRRDWTAPLTLVGTLLLTVVLLRRRSLSLRFVFGAVLPLVLALSLFGPRLV